MCLLTRNSIRRAHNNSARIFSAPVLFLFVCSREDANWRVSTSGTEMAQEEDVLYFPIDLLLFAPGVFTGSRNNISFRFSSILMFACLPVCVVVVVCCWTGFRPKKENSVVQRWRDLICPFITRKKFCHFHSSRTTTTTTKPVEFVCLEK